MPAHQSPQLFIVPYASIGRNIEEPLGSFRACRSLAGKGGKKASGCVAPVKILDVYGAERKFLKHAARLVNPQKRLFSVNRGMTTQPKVTVTRFVNRIIPLGFIFGKGDGHKTIRINDYFLGRKNDNPAILSLVNGSNLNRGKRCPFAKYLLEGAYCFRPGIKHIDAFHPLGETAAGMYEPEPFLPVLVKVVNLVVP